MSWRCLTRKFAKSELGQSKRTCSLSCTQCQLHLVQILSSQGTLLLESGVRVNTVINEDASRTALWLVSDVVRSCALYQPGLVVAGLGRSERRSMKCWPGLCKVLGLPMLILEVVGPSAWFLRIIHAFICVCVVVCKHAMLADAYMCGHKDTNMRGIQALDPPCHQTIRPSIPYATGYSGPPAPMPPGIQAHHLPCHQAFTPTINHPPGI